MTDVTFGLGSNLGRPLEQLARAVEMLGRSVEIGRVSSVYLTAPVGYVDQPDFYNIVVQGRSAAAAETLLSVALGIERELGRIRTFRNAPRSIDIDLLDRGGEIRESDDLILPHPRLHERPFVLVPLAEIDPDWRHPVLGLTSTELLAQLPMGERIERVGRLQREG